VRSSHRTHSLSSRQSLTSPIGGKCLKEIALAAVTAVDQADAVLAPLREGGASAEGKMAKKEARQALKKATAETMATLQRARADARAAVDSAEGMPKVMLPSVSCDPPFDLRGRRSKLSRSECKQMATKPIHLWHGCRQTRWHGTRPTLLHQRDPQHCFSLVGPGGVRWKVGTSVGWLVVVDQYTTAWRRESRCWHLRPT
jgi:hypothetical protein